MRRFLRICRSQLLADGHKHFPLSFREGNALVSPKTAPFPVCHASPGAMQQARQFQSVVWSSLPSPSDLVDPAVNFANVCLAYGGHLDDAGWNAVNAKPIKTNGVFVFTLA